MKPANPLLPCPLLPDAGRPISVADGKALGNDRGAKFYEHCLLRAQWKWQSGFPAQALLQLNKAMAADLRGDEEVLERWPMPYAAVAWMLRSRPDLPEGAGYFLGNPRRHWQHYATRMSGPRAETRTWRAWACWWIAEQVLPPDAFPRDEKQISDEGIRLPDWEEIAAALGDEAELVAGAL